MWNHFVELHLLQNRIATAWNFLTEVDSFWHWIQVNSGDRGIGDIIRWYGEDMYEKPNLFGVCAKSGGDENFCSSIFWLSSRLLKVFTFYLNITCWSSCWARHLSYADQDFKSIASYLEIRSSDTSAMLFRFLLAGKRYWKSLIWSNSASPTTSFLVFLYFFDTFITGL